MKPDAMINGVSMLSLGWLRETVNFPTPQSQTNTITVPGRNFPIRFTEALGRVAYQPRSFDMTFSMLGDRADFDILVSTVVNQFAGKLCRVTLTEDPMLYAVGTLEAVPSYDPLTGKGTLELSCTDGDAFLYHVEETVVNFSGGGTVVLTNDYMPVVPVITATAETTLRWAIDSESFQKTVSAGTWEIPELELRHGKNTISVTSEGTVAGDVIRFALKQRYTDAEPLICKEIPHNGMNLRLEAEETKALKAGGAPYVYDVQITMEGGTVCSFIDRAKFTVTEEVD